MIVCRSIKSLETQIELELEKHRVELISWDVFDTLILRKCAPVVVLESAARWLDHKLMRLGVIKTPRSLNAYHIAYKTLADANVAKGLDCEVFADQLYLAWVKEASQGDVNVADELARELAEKMEQYEKWSCVRNDKLVPVLDRLSKRNIRMTYVSDMYLGGKCVANILQHLQLSHYFPNRYVSSDYALLKRTGRLFNLVVDTERVRAANVLHIGDNRLADGEMAVASGLRSIVLELPAEIRYRRAFGCEYSLFKGNRMWGGHFVASFAQLREDHTVMAEEAYARRILGPIYVSFAHRVLERCKELGIRHIYFIAREGYFLRQIARRLLSVVYDQTPHPQLTYLLASRISTAHAASPSFGMREISLAAMNGHLNLRNLLSPLSLDSEQVNELAIKYGIPNGTTELPRHYLTWPPFIALINDEKIQQRWSELHLRNKALLNKYLYQCGFFDHNIVAIVDVGWSAQIQESLYLATRSASNPPAILGLYMALRLSAHWRRRENNWVEWVLADEEHSDWQAHSAFSFPQGLEFVTRSPHGTVLTYAQEGDCVSAVLKDEEAESREVERKLDPLIAVLQHGVLGFADEYAKLAVMCNLSAADTIPYARDMMERMIRFPEAWEASRFLEIENVSDFGSEQIFKLGANAGPFSLFSLKKLKSQLAVSFWKSGTLALHPCRQTLQFLWSSISETRTIKKYSAPYGEAIPRFPAPAQIANPSFTQTKTDGQAIIENSLDHKIDSMLAKNLELARIHSHMVGGPENTAPFSFIEWLSAYATYCMARLVCYFTKRRRIYRGGIRAKLYIKFEIQKRDMLDGAVRRARSIFKFMSRSHDTSS